MILNGREIIEHILESMPGVVVTDVEGRIVYLSESYAILLKVDRNQSVGKHVADIIPGSRMQLVAQTGQEEIGAIFVLKNGESILINRIPIRMDGKIIGAIGYSTLTNNNEHSTTGTIEQIKRLSQEVSHYKNELKQLRGAKYSIEQIIGSVPSILRIKDLIKKAAQTKSTVLITGETGTGKELVAHALHQLSPRSHHSFIRVNCAAIPDDLLESELFGYEEGAFTGAKKGGKVGKCELANYGTLLFDEINQMPLYLQSKLLRIIQEKEVDKVGGTNPVEIDVRFIFTTNQNLLHMVEKGTFREDLYYRINVVSIDIPPLKTRIDDIPLLVEHLIAKINRDLGLHITGIEPEVIEKFKLYSWPGNIRELEHSLERAANIAMSRTLEIEHFEHIRQFIPNENYQGIKDDKTSLAYAKTKAERELIIQALAQTGGNVASASKTLKIHRSVLYEKIKKYSIVI